MSAPNKPSHAYAVVNSDVTVFEPSEIWSGAGGNITVVTAGGETVLYTGYPAGTLLPVMCKQVLATGTVPTDLVRQTYP